MFFLLHLIYSFSAIRGNTQSLFYAIISYPFLNPKLEYYNLSDKALKKQIAQDLNVPQHLYLESWIKSITVLRNCIAHHARIWNRRFPNMPQLPKRMPKAWIGNTRLPMMKLYAQLCCIAYLQNSIHPDNTFKQNLFALLEAHPNVDVKAMGFPANWREEPLWKD
ncbi:MAG: Abi family protein [Candidatus Paraprevotella stercoravium]|uniref:Abi family protein n=1 Tax=Candidatus Paraprevotella stercoravium TaxID=2838725 RepID=A0A9E2P3B9_9BACT|nr:Abi family protein [Candidatus Paraprevotella stercoravium]